LVKATVEPDAVYVLTDPRPVVDAAVVAGCWEQLFRSPARALISYHDEPGYSRQEACGRQLVRAVEKVHQRG